LVRINKDFLRSKSGSFYKKKIWVSRNLSEQPEEGLFELVI